MCGLLHVYLLIALGLVANIFSETSKVVYPLFPTVASDLRETVETMQLGRRILANFPPEGINFSFDFFDFRRIHKYGVMKKKTISMLFYYY